MKIVRMFKLALAYNKAKRLLKKDKVDLEKLQECRDNLAELIIDLEETGLELKEEIKKINKVVSEITKKIAKEVK